MQHASTAVLACQYARSKAPFLTNGSPNCRNPKHSNKVLVEGAIKFGGTFFFAILQLSCLYGCTRKSDSILVAVTCRPDAPSVHHRVSQGYRIQNPRHSTLGWLEAYKSYSRQTCAVQILTGQNLSAISRQRSMRLSSSTRSSSCRASSAPFGTRSGSPKI